MANNWAICIGINHYANMPDLTCAKWDALKMKQWFVDKAGFENNHVFLFTDDNTDQNFRPTGNTLKRFFRLRFQPNSLNIEDNLWFFFSGHGLFHEGKDYLMPLDGDPDPEGVPETAISVSDVTQRLRDSGAGDVVIIYDACRDQARAKGMGMEIEPQKGVITLASCSRQQRSYEIDDPSIQQGSFTYALLEALENTRLGRDNYATFDRLYQRLKYRVPEINRLYGKPDKQNPYGFAEPDEKRYSILLPKQALTQDFETYKKQALNAEANNNLHEAERLLIRLWEFCPGDSEVRQYYNRVILKKYQQPSQEVVKLSLQPEPIPTPSKSVTESSPKVTEIELKSEKGVDYTKLRDLLAKGKWKEADQETANVMLQAANRVSQGWLNESDIDNFPCDDLRTIDQLWVHYSHGKFGFSVQKKIYMDDLGGTRQYNQKIWYEFCDRVGWRKGGDYVSYSDFTFELLDTTPVAHLPLVVVWGLGWGRGWLSSLAPTSVTCSISAL